MNKIFFLHTPVPCSTAEGCLLPKSSHKPLPLPVDSPFPTCLASPAFWKGICWQLYLQAYLLLGCFYNPFTTYGLGPQTGHFLLVEPDCFSAPFKSKTRKPAERTCCISTLLCWLLSEKGSHYPRSIPASQQASWSPQTSPNFIPSYNTEHTAETTEFLDALCSCPEHQAPRAPCWFNALLLPSGNC